MENKRNSEIPDMLPDCKSIKNFLKGFHTESTKHMYCRKLSQFLNYNNVTPDKMLLTSKRSPKKIQNMIIDYIEDRKKEVSGSTLQLLKGALKHFFEMNDVESGINWPKISKMIPHARKTGQDRAPSIEEIRRMIDVADLRTKCIILICATSGIRVGAFEGMTWGELIPINEERNDLVGAKIVVYKGEIEQYITFVTSECYRTIQQYMSARETIGEKITKNSPLIRDTWDNNTYRKDKTKDPKIPKPLTSKSIANMMGIFLKKINMRQEKVKSNRYDFKQIHGFRKYFKTNAERTMKTLDVEKLMGHAENYYKPPEEYLLEQYATAVLNLTISEAYELKGKLKSQINLRDKKVGELERENMSLQYKLDQIDDKYNSLRDLIDTVVAAKTKQE